MRQRKGEKDMTVAELARMTNTAFGDLETRMNRQFHDIHMNFATKVDLRETEERLLLAINHTETGLRETEERLMDVLNRIEIKMPDLEDLKNEVADLSGRVTLVEKKP